MRTILVLLTAMSLLALGCTKEFKAIPVGQCPQIVEYSKKVLGPNAKSNSEMMDACKAANPRQRGCALAAKTTGELIRCSVVK